jgi:hypothetical protein
MDRKRTQSTIASRSRSVRRSRGYKAGDGEKAFYVAIVTFALVFTGLLAHGSGFRTDVRASHVFAHRSRGIDRARNFEFDPGTLAERRAVYSRAMTLAAEHDSRPHWAMPRLVAGQPVPRATADLAIEYLIPCESGGRAINHLDTDGKMSYGILQFQDWDEWERMSGISGDPQNPDDAIRMAEWGIEHGMIDHWGCAKILRII